MAMVVILWIPYPSVREPLQLIGGTLVFAGTAIPVWISAVPRR
ncbi:hypothetical protein [Streptomyces sp. WM6378]|nr:hypothetical protein [Streptomyces sp. WM6378]